MLMKMAQCEHLDMQPGRVLHHDEPRVWYHALKLGAETLLQGEENHQKHTTNQGK